MSTRSRVLFSIVALPMVMAVMSGPVSGQDVGSRATRPGSAGRTVRQADRPVGRGGGAAADQGGRGRGGRGGGAALPAGPIPRRPDGKPDLTGHWSGVGQGLTNSVILEDHAGGFGIQAGKTLIIDPPDGIIPYQPWGLAERNRRRDDANGYEDPVGHCEFYDIGRVQMFPQEIMYAGDTIIINVTQHITRVVDMKRQQHLPDSIRLWVGDPIGRWEGDTLVVDSTNFNGRTRMAIGGDFYSPNAHIVERWAPVDANTLRWTLTIDDPTVFTRPWTMTSAVPMRRVAGAAEFNGEDTCHEGNTDLAHLKNTYEQAHGTKASWVKVAPTKP